MPVSKRPRKKSKKAAEARGSGHWILTTFLGIPLVVIVGYFAIERLIRTDEGAQVEVRVQVLSPAASRGEGLFVENCAGCHGANAAGSNRGPALVHPIYEPNHHGDRAFYIAVRRGVRAHHWRYGNMAPVSEITDEEVGLIVRYVRELQQANGIM